jgi:hypothetical protein
MIAGPAAAVKSRKRQKKVQLGWSVRRSLLAPGAYLTVKYSGGIVGFG